jgi:hypothetical protein
MLRGHRVLETRLTKPTTPTADAAALDEVTMTNDNPKPARKAAAVIKPTHVNDPVTEALKRLHDSVAEEPVPDSFMELMAQIEAKIDRDRG